MSGKLIDASAVRAFFFLQPSLINRIFQKGIFVRGPLHPLSSAAGNIGIRLPPALCFPFFRAFPEAVNAKHPKAFPNAEIRHGRASFPDYPLFSCLPAGGCPGNCSCPPRGICLIQMIGLKRDSPPKGQGLHFTVLLCQEAAGKAGVSCRADHLVLLCEFGDQTGGLMCRIIIFRGYITNHLHSQPVKPFFEPFQPVSVRFQHAKGRRCRARSQEHAVYICSVKSMCGNCQLIGLARLHRKITPECRQSIRLSFHSRHKDRPCLLKYFLFHSLSLYAPGAHVSQAVSYPGSGNDGHSCRRFYFGLYAAVLLFLMGNMDNAKRSGEGSLRP